MVATAFALSKSVVPRNFWPISLLALSILVAEGTVGVVVLSTAPALMAAMCVRGVMLTTMPLSSDLPVRFTTAMMVEKALALPVASSRYCAVRLSVVSSYTFNNKAPL